MNEGQIVDFWFLLKEYVEKKHLEIVAEKYVDMLADYGTTDEVFKEVLGSDSILDDAIGYYLEIDADAFIDNEDEWE